ncbi:hypothetical protein SCLCIDRAFT_34765 [Scleroderma citrinum Foug A]|uniref:Uncharacterized protein n=1 Tax=Scleroderma citrinum Foug A TaxID=1036808 RepID=A0A0C2ZA90_9AGAM|nr:hypothetical protein SCLCIDRAFT_34765 [Scleroderma citrinum Foug A]
MTAFLAYASLSVMRRLVSVPGLRYAHMLPGSLDPFISLPIGLLYKYWVGDGTIPIFNLLCNHAKGVSLRSHELSVSSFLRWPRPLLCDLREFPSVYSLTGGEVQPTQQTSLDILLWMKIKYLSLPKVSLSYDPFIISLDAAIAASGSKDDPSVSLAP